jgi:hypothetical protein
MAEKAANGDAPAKVDTLSIAVEFSYVHYDNT